MYEVKMKRRILQDGTAATADAPTSASRTTAARI